MAKRKWLSSDEKRQCKRKIRRAASLARSHSRGARTRAEEELRERTAFWEAQVNCSIDGILVVDRQGQKLLQNPQMGALWSIPPEISEDEDDAAQVAFVTSRVKDAETFTEIVKYLYAHPDQTDRREIELIDGTVLDRYSSPVIGRHGQNYGRIWTFRDVTEEHRREAALRESEDRLRTLAESIPQLVFVCSIDGWNTFFNQRWVDYTGMSLEESHGHGWNKAFHADDQGHGSHANENNDSYELECRIRRWDGVYRWFLVRGQPLCDASGQVTQWFGTCTDIHDLKIAEEELRKAQNELEDRVEERTRELSIATDMAHRANHAKSEFLSRMSHELRTPLNAILGFGQVLDMGKKADHPDKEILDLILKSGRHLLTLVNEVLDIAGVEAGRLGMSIEPVCVADLVSEACSLVAPLAKQARINVFQQIEPNAHLYVMADNHRLRQVMLNLLSNGIKYNRPDGDLAVTAVKTPDGSIRISVRDTGQGITPENLEKLFTPFERLDAINSQIEGSGLGLVLSQRLVSAMNGTLDVISVQGEGSTFTCELPAAAPPLERIGIPEILANELPDPAHLSSYRTVLCIEDNMSNLRLMQVIMASRPTVRLISAIKGALGLELARQEHPDLILLDLNLPDIPGPEILKTLLADDATKDIPVMVVSADATPTQVARLLASGARAYLTKPIEVREFLTTLDDLLDERKTA